MEHKVPWYVARKVPPIQVKEWLEELKARERPRLFTEEQWRTILQGWKTRKLKVSNDGNSGRHCPRCGCELHHFYVTTDEDTLKRAREDPAVRRIISGHICWTCIETYFL